FSYGAISLATVEALLAAAAKWSLTALEQAVVALPGYRAQVEAELRALAPPVPPPGDKVFEWNPVVDLAGKQFSTEEEVDRTLRSVGHGLKAQIREGFTVVVK